MCPLGNLTYAKISLESVQVFMWEDSVDESHALMLPVFWVVIAITHHNASTLLTSEMKYHSVPKGAPHLTGGSWSPILTSL